MSRPPAPPSFGFASKWTQTFPPTPAFTEKDLPDLDGKVYIVTGSNTGVGKEVAQILYSRNAKVYIAARSKERANQAIADIQKAHPDSNGSLLFLHLDLGDLSTIKASCDEFLSRESQLHVLFNNAGVMALKEDGPTRTPQGHEIHLGVNVFGTFVLTQLLTPILVATAKTEPRDSVRVVWVSSMGTETIGEKSRGMSSDYVDYWPVMTPLERYGISKAGNWVHAWEYGRRHKDDGVLSVPCNPGHLRSNLYRDGSMFFRMFINTFITHPPVYGAYTEIFAGLSPSVTMEHTGSWVVPWGRFYPIRQDLLDATKPEAEGGNGNAEKFWDWTEDQVREFLR